MSVRLYVRMYVCMYMCVYVLYIYMYIHMYICLISWFGGTMQVELKSKPASLLKHTSTCADADPTRVLQELC